jgi:hypothetical protein
MADTNEKNRAGDLRPDPKTDVDNLRDEEFEMPDPEQVEKDREQAERLYREEERRDPAA